MERKERFVGKAYDVSLRFAGQLFRATKISSTCLLLWCFAVPIGIKAYLSIYALIYHSRLPADIFLGGILEVKNRFDPDTLIPPEFADLLNKLTPGQKQQGQMEFEVFSMLSLAAGIIFLWWLVTVTVFVFRKGWLPQPE